MSETYVGKVVTTEDGGKDKKGTRLGTKLGFFAAGAALTSIGFMAYGNAQPESNASLASTVEGCIDATKSTQVEKTAKINDRVTSANEALDAAQAEGKGIAEAAKALETVREETADATSALVTEMQVLFDTCLTTDVQTLLGEAGVNTGVELNDVMMPTTTNGTEG